MTELCKDLITQKIFSLRTRHDWSSDVSIKINVKQEYMVEEEARETLMVSQDLPLI